ncbi:MAG TPA: hypothetical protein VGO04_23990 [Ensifer sp.]|jgi:hypothetical protein|uniref:hypothetical protein n=1 Tax=Ensifer sp. TaxID=1872086 RepID=UPI002E0E9C75|nr:hypothetical protein [Ensifer sp.]
MWEKLQRGLETGLAQLRKHPELMLLIAFAYAGLILTVKDTHQQFGSFGVLVAAAIAVIVSCLALRLRRAPQAAPPQVAPPKDDNAELLPPEGDEAETLPPEDSKTEPLPLALPRACAEGDGQGDRPYLVRVPPSRTVAYDAARKARGVFQRNAIDPGEGMKVFFSDPYSLICLQDKDDNIFGFVDYCAFEKNQFKLFLQGEYTFDNLLSGGLLAHPQARKAKVVYLATILNLSFLLDSMRAERRRQNGILVLATVSAILEHHTFPPDGIDIYSIGWDRSGRAILRMFGLQPVSRVIRGQAEGKWIYSKRGVRRADLEVIRARYQRRYARWCELDVRPPAATEPGVAVGR